MKNKTLIFIVSVGLLFGIMILVFLMNNRNGVNNDNLEKFESSRSEIISKDGLHWHTELAIYVKGEKVEIPANIGITKIHNPIHTHTEDSKSGVIHLEFPGVVRLNDTKLGEFFKVWGKDINSFGTNMKMTINGVESTEFENYLMKDGDKVELKYD